MVQRYHHGDFAESISSGSIVRFLLVRLRLFCKRSDFDIDLVRRFLRHDGGFHQTFRGKTICASAKYYSEPSVSFNGTYAREQKTKLLVCARFLTTDCCERKSTSHRPGPGLVQNSQ